MASTIVYKKSDANRIAAQIILDGTPLALGDKRVTVRLADSDTAGSFVELTEGAGQVTVEGGSEGRFSWLVTSANLATIGDPEQVWTVVSAWNSDDTLAFTAAGYVSVEL
jgi:hypothetical protein